MPKSTKNPRQHSSLVEMVRDLTDDAFADELAKVITSRQLVKALMVQRNRAGMSQDDVAGKMELTPGKVAKLENSTDAELNFGDILGYLDAVGCEMRVQFVPKEMSIVDEVKMHASIICQLLARLVEIAEEDESNSKGISRFLGDAALNLTRLIQDASSSLPSLAETSPTPLQVHSILAALKVQPSRNTNSREQKEAIGECA